MPRTVAFLVSLFFCGALLSQENKYWIRFTDKNNNSFSVDNPQQFLSPLSIERRTKQNILVDETDLPITESYINSIFPYIDTLVHRLKWTNMVVADIDSLPMLDSILQFSFVDTIGKIEENPNREAYEQNKFEDVYPVNQEILIDTNTVYGIAYRQTNMLNVDLLHQLGWRGQGVLMSSFDNGFLNVHTIAGFDSVRPRILNTYDFVNHQTDVYHGGSHGTNTFSDIAGNIPRKFLGTAPDASFLLIQTEDNTREWVMEEYNWQAGAEYADSIGAKIFTTSLGYTTFNYSIGSHSYADLDGHTTVITRAANLAAGKGILVLNSAGNEGDKSWHYISTPADGDSVIAIGAVDSGEAVTNFSGRGPNSAGRIKPDICAQGTKSAIILDYGGIGYSGGTSFSCPIMAGAFASLWSAFPDKTAREIYTAVLVSSDNFWTPDNHHGYGIPNFYNAYQLLKTNYNENILRLSDDVVVYPNPFSTELNLSFFSGADKTHRIDIFDLKGSKVYSNEIFLRDKTFELVKFTGFEKLPAGEYILMLNGQKNFTHRIMKLK